MVKCSNCGKQIKISDQFCPSCGYKKMNESGQRMISSKTILGVSGLILVGIIVFLLLFVVFINNKKPDDRLIKNDIYNTYGSFSYTNPLDGLIYTEELEVESINIIKSKSEDNTYYAEVDASLNNNNYIFTKHLILYYGKYDGGKWYLESIESNTDDEYTVLNCPFTTEDVIRYVRSENDTWMYQAEMVEAESSVLEDTYMFNVSHVETYTFRTAEYLDYVYLTFDGVNWNISYEDRDILFNKWNILGTWETIDNSNYSVTMNLTGFDYESESGTGTVYAGDEDYEEVFNIEDAEITCYETEIDIFFLEGSYYKVKIKIYDDSANAGYRLYYWRNESTFERIKASDSDIDVQNTYYTKYTDDELKEKLGEYFLSQNDWNYDGDMSVSVMPDDGGGKRVEISYQDSPFSVTPIWYYIVDPKDWTIKDQEGNDVIIE